MSISQSDTVTKDSLICLPKHTLVQAIQDLERGDACAKKTLILESTIASYDSIVGYKDKMIVDLREKNKINELDLKAYKITLDRVNADYHNSLVKIKRKNTIIAVSVSANIILGAALYLISVR